MDYITIAQAASNWGVSSRRVYKYLEDNRIEGAVRYGAAWLIPQNAEKPGDPRKIMKTSQHDLRDDLSLAIGQTFHPVPRDDPYKLMNSITDETLRLLPEALIAYMKGDFERVIYSYDKSEGNGAAKLILSMGAIPAAISLGDYSLYLEVEKWLKSIAKPGQDAGVAAYAELALATGYVGASALSMVPEWLKIGDLTELHPLVRYEANVKRAEYYKCLKKYDSMLDIAQTTLSLLGTMSSCNQFSSTEINLLIRCAMACHCLGRDDEAKRWLMGAMRLALPHGFITPFAETITTLGGLTEVCLKEAFPKWHDAVLEQGTRTIRNWVTFHNRFTKDNISIILTVQETHVASLAARKIPRAEIARRLHYSEGWVNKTIADIYEKLMVNNRDELANYILP